MRGEVDSVAGGVCWVGGDDSIDEGVAAIAVEVDA